MVIFQIAPSTYQGITIPRGNHTPARCGGAGRPHVANGEWRPPALNPSPAWRMVASVNPRPCRYARARSPSGELQSARWVASTKRAATARVVEDYHPVRRVFPLCQRGERLHHTRGDDTRPESPAHRATSGSRSHPATDCHDTGDTSSAAWVWRRVAPAYDPAHHSVDRAHATRHHRCAHAIVTACPAR